MEEKTMNALQWTVAILNKNNITYRIGGGFVTHLYGSDHPVNDIELHNL